MSEQDLQKIMFSLSKIPPYPIPDAPRLREMLVEQILAFQARYTFMGNNTPNFLSRKKERCLSRAVVRHAALWDRYQQSTRCPSGLRRTECVFRSLPLVPFWKHVMAAAPPVRQDRGSVIAWQGI